MGELIKLDPPFKAYKGIKPYIFVSYAHKDSDLIFPIIKRLHDHGVNIWYDQGIDLSTKWAQEIYDNLEKCSGFIVFLSHNAINSKWLKTEIKIAYQRYINKDIKFIPIFLQSPGSINLPGDIKQIGTVQGLVPEISEKEFWIKIDDFTSSFKNSLVNDEKEIIKSLESILGEKIPMFEDLKSEKFGLEPKDNHVFKLRLREKDLSEIPDTFCNFKKLEELDLSQNYLKQLPINFGNLSTLKNLELSQNYLKTLPISFGNLNSLMNLDLNQNKLVELHPEFKNLDSLINLDLSWNKFTSLPQFLNNLTNLDNLLIVGNPLTFSNSVKTLVFSKKINTSGMAVDNIVQIPQGGLFLGGSTINYDNYITTFDIRKNLYIQNQHTPPVRRLRDFAFLKNGIKVMVNDSGEIEYYDAVADEWKIIKIFYDSKKKLQLEKGSPQHISYDNIYIRKALGFPSTLCEWELVVVDEDTVYFLSICDKIVEKISTLDKYIVDLTFISNNYLAILTKKNNNDRIWICEVDTKKINKLSLPSKKKEPFCTITKVNEENLIASTKDGGIWTCRLVNKRWEFIIKLKNEIEQIEGVEDNQLAIINTENFTPNVKIYRTDIS